MNIQEIQVNQGARIREQRKLRSMRQADLAGLLGVAQITVSRYEAGEREIPPLIQHQLALVFGVDVDRLFPAPRSGLTRSR